MSDANASLPDPEFNQENDKLGLEPVGMTDEQREMDNQYRLSAAAFIRQLWTSGNTRQLRLLKMQIDASLDRPYQRR